MNTQETLQQAIHLAQVGDKVVACQLLSQIIQQESDNEIAWLWLASCVEEIHEKRRALEQVLRINPANIQASQALETITSTPTPLILSKIKLEPQNAASTTTQPQKSWWQNLPPDMRASLSLSIIYFIIGMINLTTGGLGFLLSFFGLLIMAFIQGFLVVRFALQDIRYTNKNKVVLALQSGIWTWFFSALFFILGAIILIGISLGTIIPVLFATLPVILVLTLTELPLFSIGSAIGAWLYTKFGGQKLIIYSCLTGCGCSILFSLLFAGLVLLLGTLGIQLLSGFTQ